MAGEGEVDPDVVSSRKPRAIDATPSDDDLQSED
jgi:hypothetical protein